MHALVVSLGCAVVALRQLRRHFLGIRRVSTNLHSRNLNGLLSAPRPIEIDFYRLLVSTFSPRQFYLRRQRLPRDYVIKCTFPFDKLPPINKYAIFALETGPFVHYVRMEIESRNGMDGSGQLALAACCRSRTHSLFCIVK